MDLPDGVTRRGTKWEVDDVKLLARQHRVRVPEQTAPPQPIGPRLLDEGSIHFALDTALRIGEVQMATGAGASDVTATILAVTDGFGLPQCEVNVVGTSITVTCHRGSEASPITAVRVVRSRSMDYTRLSETEELVTKITRGRVDVHTAASEINRINEAPHPYPRWVATLALGAMAASITVLIGGDPLTAALAFVVSALIDRVGRILNRRALPLFFQQVVGGLIASLFSVLALSSDLPFESPSLVAAAAITVLLSGLGTVSAVHDAVTGYNVTAAGRTMEVIMMTAGLVTGVVIALQLALTLGIPRAPLPTLPGPSAISLPVEIVAGAAAAGFFALASYARLRALLLAATAGGVGTTVYSVLRLAEADKITATALAAVLLGFCGGVLSRRLRVTPLVVAVSGITPLLPGLLAFRGLYEAGVEPGGQLGTLMQAFAVGLALAAGVVFGEYLAQPVRTQLGRLERKLAGPRMAGPLRPSRRKLQ